MRGAPPRPRLRARARRRAGLRSGSRFPLLGRLGGRRWSALSLGLAAPLPCCRGAREALGPLALTHLVVPFGLAAGLLGGAVRPGLGRRQLHPGATRLGEAYRDSLFARAHAVLALVHVFHLL